MDYALLYNPVAGRGRALAIAEAASRFLAAEGHGVVEGQSERPGHVAELAAAHAADVDRILVLGGDGSLREAATGLLGEDGRGAGRRATLGVIPMGSGNVVARELGLSLDPMAALRQLSESEERLFDVAVARVDGATHLFLAMLGVGFDAEVAGGVDRARRTRLGGRIYRQSGDLVYGAVGLGTLVAGRRARLTVTADGAEVAERAAAAVICNARVYGKGMVLTPDARTDDGVLDVHVRRSGAPWVTATALARAHAHRPIPRWAGETRRGARIGVRSAACGGVAWQLDGDPMGRASSIEVEVVPSALRLLAPRTGTETGE